MRSYGNDDLPIISKGSYTLTSEELEFEDDLTEKEIAEVDSGHLQ